MKYQILGKTGVKVSEICFGTMSFGGDADEKTSHKMFDLCRESGVNFFDCANVYQKGTAETILGKCIRGCRDELVITSKVYFPMGEGVNERGATRLHIRQSVEASLKRLGTDRLDVLFIHRFDDLTPLEETMRVLDDLVRDGKVLYPAASNFAAWQVMKGLGIADKRGWSSFYVLQPMYNLVKRQAEVEVLPLAESEGLAVIPFSPLASGLLAGKYGKTRRPDSGRLVENKMYQVRYGNDTNYDVAEAFSRFAQENGYNPVALAIKWVSAHPAVTAPIIGARNTEQLKSALESVNIEMDGSLYQTVSDLSPAPPPATDRTEERTEFHYGVRT